MSDFNVKAQYNSDGTVTVVKGGLYQKKRTFKTENAFKKETDKKLSAYESYYSNSADRTKKGYISQLQAEVLKGELQNRTQSDALKSFGKKLNQSINSDKTKVEAIQDMRERLKFMSNK